ncbi:hypothetical protein [Phyllobacterium endophyticum]|uniref:hypothetical protein n=1 Tax=Phyllobacterium endophyticum TaxID=1149773 RepID=UPI0011C9D06E|nr:hypothetical protein [Phyllobacterium endophyticum]TXR49899.1 hypothetical protein FVA77_07755 [Phyllobacterium endophyticum]
MCKVKQPKPQIVKPDPVPETPPPPAPVATVIAGAAPSTAADDASLAIRKSRGASKLNKNRGPGKGKAPTVDKTGSGVKTSGNTLGIGTIKR